VSFRDEEHLPIDTDPMVRYGVSATPTYALIDRKGAAPFYSPTRLSEFELSRRIEAVWDRLPDSNYFGRLP